MGKDGGSVGMRIMYFVWFWLLLMTMIEVGLAYMHVPLTVMLVTLLGLSVVKAVLIVAYFMHLKFERLSLVLTLIPALVMCILLLNIIYPDSLRIQKRGVFRELPPPVPVQTAPAGH